MNDDIHSAADADVQQKPTGSDQRRQAFYVVSPQKFIVLYFATFGLYGIYWHYKHWAYQKEALALDIWPVPRGLFNVFFVHALFNAADQQIKPDNKAWAWNPSSLATAWALLWIAERVLGQLVQSGQMSAAGSVIGVLTMPVMAYIGFQAQYTFNFAENDPKGESNSQFTQLNFIWVAMGSLIWSLAGLGLYASLSGQAN